MLWLLAFFGSVIEIAEIPTIIVLLIWCIRLRKEVVAVRKELQESFWEAGLEAPKSVVSRDQFKHARR